MARRKDGRPRSLPLDHYYFDPGEGLEYSRARQKRPTQPPEAPMTQWHGDIS